jgi:hypothetical protein
MNPLQEYFMRAGSYAGIIERLFRHGYGVTLNIEAGVVDHALTAWGVDGHSYLWLTDSDNDGWNALYSGPGAPNALSQVTLHNGGMAINYGGAVRAINGVYALQANPYEFPDRNPPVLYNLEVDSDTHDLGYLRVGTSSQVRTATVCNNIGLFTSIIEGHVDAPRPDGSFVSLEAGRDFSLRGGEFPVQLDVDFAFDPQQRGACGEDIAVINDHGNKSITLAGICVGPVVELFPESESTLGFGEMQRGWSGTLLLELGNTTSDDAGGDLVMVTLTINDVVFKGPDADLFSLTGLTPGTQIFPGETLTLGIRFDAPDSLGDRSAMLTLFTDENAPLGGNGSDFSFDLCAEVVPLPSMLVLLTAGAIPLLVKTPRRG